MPEKRYLIKTSQSTPRHNPINLNFFCNYRFKRCMFCTYVTVRIIKYFKSFCNITIFRVYRIDPLLQNIVNSESHLM
jgi:hypothetical protein